MLVYEDPFQIALCKEIRNILQNAKSRHVYDAYVPHKMLLFCSYVWGMMKVKVQKNILYVWFTFHLVFYSVAT